MYVCMCMHICVNTTMSFKFLKSQQLESAGGLSTVHLLIGHDPARSIRYKPFNQKL